MDLVNLLNCPISLTRLVEPLNVPCCSQTFSRLSLINALATDPRCPLCRAPLGPSVFNPQIAPINVIVADLLQKEDEDKKREEKKLLSRPTVPATAEWKAIMEKVYDDENQFVGEAKRTISVSHSSFVLLPNLFVMVADRSGSMSGRPWTQVEHAIVHIVSMARLSKMVDLGIVVYGSDAKMVQHPYDITSTNLLPLQIAGGGTNFDAAFHETFMLLKQKTETENIVFNSITVAFLTDGQSTCSAEANIQLLENIRLKVKTWKGPPITLHSIGFSNACDRNFLEEIRKSGHQEGLFRFTDYNDDADALSAKLSTLFEPMLRSVKAKISINGRTRANYK